MKRFAIHLAALAMIGATSIGAAEAQGLFSRQLSKSTATVTQSGTNNGAAIAQEGPANTAGVLQKGANNAGQIKQSGVNNTGVVLQQGKNNDASLTQTGANNTGCLVQVGKGLSADVNQNGEYNSLGVVQTKKGAFTTNAADCARNPQMVAYWARRGIIVQNIK